MDTNSQNTVVTFEDVYKAVKELTRPLVDSMNKVSEQVTQMNTNRVTREDFEQMRHDIGQVARDIDDRTYTRQVMDLKLQQINEQINALREANDHRISSVLHEITELRTVQTGMWERVLTRVSSVTMLVFILMQILPHLTSIFH